MSSFEPDGCGNQIDGGEEVASCFVVAGRDGSKLFEAAEEIFYQMPLLVEVFVVGAGHCAVGLRRDYRGFASCFQEANDPLVGIVCFVREQYIGLHGRQKMVGAEEVVSLTAGQHKGDCIAKSIDQGMDLGAQPTS